MKSTRSWKRSISLAAMVGVACSALQAATPKLDLHAAAAPAIARELRLHSMPRAPKPRSTRIQSALAELLGHGSTAGPSRNAGFTQEPAPKIGMPPEADTGLDLWSLIAGGLGVMIFVASRRRAD